MTDVRNLACTQSSIFELVISTSTSIMDMVSIFFAYKGIDLSPNRYANKNEMQSPSFVPAYPSFQSFRWLKNSTQLPMLPYLETLFHHS